MIQFLRDKATGLVAKAMLVVIAGAVVITGAETLNFNQKSPDVLATVGETPVLAADVNALYRSQMQRFQQLLNAGIPAELIRQRVIAGIMEQKINSALFAEYTERLGLIVPENVIINEIAAMPEFQSAGSFDKVKYQELLKNAGMTEAGFASSLKKGLPQDYLQQSLRDMAALPPSALALLQSFEGEERTVSVARKTINPAPSSSISDAEAETYYQANQKRFLSPERRSAQYVVFKSMPVAQDSISDADVAAAFEARRAALTTKATRTTEQWLFADEASASAARAALSKASWPSLSEGAFKNNWSDLGKRTRGDLPAPLAEALFKDDVAAAQVIGPVKSALGYHLLFVKAATPEKTPTLAEIAPSLRKTLSVEAGYKKLVEQSEQFEKALDEGRSLREAAAAAGITVQQWQSLSRDEAATAPVLSDNPGLINGLFTAAANENSGLQELAGDGGYMYFNVNSIKPAAPRPFAEVSGAVKETLAAQQARRKALQEAETVLESRKSTSLAAAATEAGFSAPEAQRLKRSDAANSTLPQGLREQLFALQRGACASDDAAGVITLACVDSVRFPAAKQTTAENQGAADISMDIADQLLESLKAVIPVVRNETALARLAGQE